MSGAPVGAADKHQRQLSGREQRIASPELNPVTTVGEILCFAGEEPRRAPQVRGRGYAGLTVCSNVCRTAEVEQPREEEEEAIKAFFGQLWGGGG